MKIKYVNVKHKTFKQTMNGYKFKQITNDFNN